MKKRERDGSERADPLLEPVALAHELTRVVERVSEQARALHRRDEVEGQVAGLSTLAEQLELRLEPLQEVLEERPGLLAQRAGFFVQLRAEAADGAAVARHRLLRVERALNERDDALSRLELGVPLRARFDRGLRHLFDQRLADRVLRLEVIVQVAERYARRLRDVCQRCPREAVLVHQPRRRIDNTRSFLGRVHLGWLTN